MPSNKTQDYALAIYESLASLFNEDSENYKYELNNVDLTAFFQAMPIANNMLHKQITGEGGDLLDYLSLNQRLVFQYLQENGREK